MTRFSFLRSTALAAALALPSAAAQADEITFWDLFDIDRIGESAVHAGISALRGFVEVRFVDLDIRPLDGYLSMSGIEMRPYDLFDYPDCLVTIDQISLISQPILQTDYTAMRLRVTGADVPVGCLDEWDRDDLLDLGIETFNVEHAVVEAEYEHASGALFLAFEATSDGHGTVTGEAAFDYASINVDYEEPVLDLAHLVVTFENDGLYELFGGEMPPFIGNAEALTALMEEEFLPGIIPPPPPPLPEPVQPSDGGKPGDAPVAEEEPAPIQPTPAPIDSPEIAMARAFIGEMAQVIADFATDPSQVTLEVAPDMAVRMAEDHFDEFYTMVYAYQPEISHGPVEAEPVSEAVIAALAAYMNDMDAGMAPGTRLALGTALMEGAGLPRNPELAVDVLTAAGDPLPISMVIEHGDLIPADEAYATLLEAAAEDDGEAFAALDGLERELELAEILDIQGPADGDMDVDDHGAAALAALQGLGAPRNYTQAYYHALIASAHGDMAAGSLVAELEDMHRLFDDAELWEEMLGDARALATEDWVAANAPEPAEEEDASDTAPADE